MANEELQIEKKIFCPKCGHMHEFSIRASVSVVNFVIDGRCVACGSAIIIDRNTIFKNAQSVMGTPVEKIDDLESINMDITSPSSNNEGVPVIDEQIMPEEKNNREIIPSNFFD
ncbi:MAG: hypothetical protein ACP5H8_02135 [Candidatus Micrarchaeia archaeon]